MKTAPEGSVIKSRCGGRFKVLGSILIAVIASVMMQLHQKKGLILDYLSQNLSTVSAVSAVSSHTGISTSQEAMDTNTSMCLPWNVDTDEWWLHNVEWEEDYQNNNDTHYCYKKIQNTSQAELLKHLYDVQWNRECTNETSFYKEMWSSGFGADMSNVVDGLFSALARNQPFQIFRRGPWPYASANGVSTCERMDMYCYFLQMSRCQVRDEMRSESFYQGRNMETEEYITLFNYATRSQGWLRREVYDFLHERGPNLTHPFMAIHVRRGDVVLHARHSRRYHAIREYIEAAQKRNLSYSHVLILTDDDNALGEARQEYPNITWMHIDRPRFKGYEGGWENPLPSKTPKVETVAVLAAFKLIQSASTFVYSSSTLGSLLAGEARRSNAAVLVNLDEGLSGLEIRNFSNFVRGGRRKGRRKGGH